MPISSNLPASEEDAYSLAKLAPENPPSHLGLFSDENQFRLHQALDSLNLFGVEVAKDGRITYCNPYFLRITGYEAAEVWGKNYFDCFVPEAEREARRQEYEQALARQGIWENKARSLLTKAGQVLHIHFSSVVLNYHEGQISGLTKIGEDVSQQHEMSLALKRSNEALQDLFDNSNDLIFICSTRGDFLFANRAFKNKVGYANEELAQLNVRDVIYHKVKRNTYRKVIEIAKGEPLPKLDTILLTKKGKLIHLEGNVSFRFENGHPTAVRGIMYDITDRIRAEKAQMLYYSIGNLTVKSKNLDHLYQSIHRELGKVIEVRNFYIKLYNDEKTEILFPYYHDEARDHEAKIRRRKSGMGLTDYVMRREKALFLYEEEIAELLSQGVIKLFGPLPKVWIGVPLKFENEVIGLISVKCYRSRGTYTTNDLELLDFISGQIALAIQRKRNEERLSNQSARLRAIFESSSHMMWSVNRKYQLTSFNNNYLQSLRQQYNLVATNQNSLLNLREELKKSDLYEFWQTRYAAAFQGEVQHFEMKDRFTDGTYRWREVYLNPIRLEDGSIEEVSAISHDITEKKLSEIALTASERKFRSIFESFQDIYFHANLLGDITLVSPSVQEILGYHPDEIVGQKISEFARETKGLEDFMNTLLRDRKIKNFEISLQSRTGQMIPSLANVRVICDETGKPLGIDGVVRDITELKKATEEMLRAKNLAERSLAVKESFLANMSHEIRTPMNGIIGMIDLMMNTELSEEQYSYMDTVRKSSETLMHILNDILDLSKMEAGKMSLHLRPTNLRLAIEKVHTLFLPQAQRRNNQLHCQIAEDVPESVEADETRLIQIIANLTSNAIKFTEAGQIWIKLHLLEQEGARLRFRVDVQDTGIGIDAENVKRLFNTFSQLDNSPSKSYGGTGLGLAISKELARLMKGHIGVDSELGQGSTFWFTFEAHLSREVAQNAQAEILHFSNHSQFSEIVPSVLVVDDNAVNRKVASEILRKAGCEVSIAQSGAECLAMLSREKKHFDLILMDIQMPDMDGVETTRRLREKFGKALPPIVAMTAYSMREDREKFLAKGLDDYISKPIKAQALINKVKEHLLPAPPNVPAKGLKGSLAQPGGTLLDLGILRQLSKYGGTELVQESLREFCEDSEILLKEAQEAYCQHQPEIIRQKIHTLKGNAGTLGVNQMARLATAMEKKLKEGNYPALAEDLNQLAQHFADFKENYIILLAKI